MEQETQTLYTITSDSQGVWGLGTQGACSLCFFLINFAYQSEWQPESDSLTLQVTSWVSTHRTMMKWFKTSIIGGRGGCAEDQWFTFWERWRKGYKDGESWGVKRTEKASRVQFPGFGSRVMTDVKCHHSVFGEETALKEFTPLDRFPVAALSASGHGERVSITSSLWCTIGSLVLVSA